MSIDDRDERTTARVYVRRLARALEDLQGRPVILSERDWERARAWHRRRIPLGLVLEILEDRGRKRPPRSLSSVDRQVEEAWGVVQAGRRGPPAAAVGADRPEDATPPREDGCRVQAFGEAARHAPGEACSEALRAARDALRRGADPSEVDRELDGRLESICPSAWALEAARTVEEELRRAGTAMPPAARARTRERAVRAALRSRLGLPPSAD